MVCRSCRLEHSPLIRCDVFARQIAGGPVVNSPVVNRDVVNAVVNKVSRQVTWQRKNRAAYNAKMREYMRKRRP